MREETLGVLEEGSIMKGTVKNITDYGAFIDLGGIDGLLHITDVSWKRINHPSEALQIGETIVDSYGEPRTFGMTVGMNF